VPVTVVVGGQFGSEGKGKVTQLLAERLRSRVTVRVGGPNSGHTVVAADGRSFVLRQLPSAAVLPEMLCVLGPGSYIDVEVLLQEIRLLGISPQQVKIDPSAVIVTDQARCAEIEAKLFQSIGSTETGTGAAVAARLARDGSATFAHNVPKLTSMLVDVPALLRRRLNAGQRVIVEGTQGFGLSLLHAREYPFVTSRDTSAASFVSEVGLSPLDVDDVVMVLRAFPIRVAGNSGPLPREIDWVTITTVGGHDHVIEERTSVTKRVRRVARFDTEVVRRAIQINAPTTIVLNHLDYLDHSCCVSGGPSQATEDFVKQVEESIRRAVDYIGLSPALLIPRRLALRVSAARV